MPATSLSPTHAFGAPNATRVTWSNRTFAVVLTVIGGAYVLIIVLLLLADVAYMARATTAVENAGVITWHNPVLASLRDPNIRYAIELSLLSCTLSALMSVCVAAPLGYVMSRWRFPGRQLLDALLDIPIVLPPLIIGLSLLILFQFPPFRWWSREIVYQVPAVVIAQFSVACAFAVRTMKTTFDEIDPRSEQVAITLGCSRWQAFGRIALPEARRGLVTAFTLA